MVLPKETSETVVVELPAGTELLMPEGPVVVVGLVEVEEAAVTGAPVVDGLPGDMEDWQATRRSPPRSAATIPPTRKADLFSLSTV